MKNFGHAIFAVGIGNALEWFDFAIFGALADVIGYHFFPAQHPHTALMSSFALYGTAFLMRPLGGILMGYIGDKYGRKLALELSVSMMVIPSFLIGSIPTFQKIGYLATLLLVCLRMLQGLAVGGEMIGAYIYTMEACREGQQGFWGGVCKATALAGTVLGMAFVAFLREVLPEHVMYQWGWRIPFLSSLALGALGLYFRSHLQESESYVIMKRQVDAMKNDSVASQERTTWKIFSLYSLEIWMCILVTSFWAAGYYTCFIWLGECCRSSYYLLLCWQCVDCEFRILYL
jgi:MFS transporter, MHS family, proline/betaine transporter